MTSDVPRERPIIFSGPEVVAILDGRKTQVRRAIKPQPDEDGLNDGGWPITLEQCPFGAVGSRLWVREKFAVEAPEYEWSVSTSIPARQGGIWYAADEVVAGARWRPSIHMPRWASRILLEITEVRGQRLQEISVDDCYAEGLDSHGDGMFRDKGLAINQWPRGEHGCDGYAQDGWDDARMVFADMWNSINGKRPNASWDSNPLIWAITFRRLKP